MTGAAGLLAEIRALEETLHRPQVRRSRPALEALLADGFVEFGSSGTVYRRAEIIDLMVVEEDEPADARLVASDYVLTPLGPDAVLLTYRTSRNMGAGGRAACAAQLHLDPQRGGLADCVPSGNRRAILAPERERPAIRRAFLVLRATLTRAREWPLRPSSRARD